MRIAVVAPHWLPIPAAAYGGIERVVSSVVNGLTERGHEITLFAPASTRCRAARLIALCPRPLCEANVPWTDINVPLAAAAKAVRLAEEEALDAVLFSVERPYYLAIMHASRVPSLFTLHGVWTPGTQPQSEIDVLYAFKNEFFASISFAQRQAMPGLHYHANIYHGIDLRQHPFSAQGGSYAAWLGRLEPEKGAHLAIVVAKRVGLKLKLAGPRRLEVPAAKRYWEEEIEPHLGNQIEWVGELAHEDKMAFLGGAAVLINPYVYLEAFGLATLEALACGTPAVVPSWGAAREIVAHGKSGFVGGSVDQWAEQTKRALLLPRSDCRKRAEAFSIESMVRGYEDALRRLVLRAREEPRLPPQRVQHPAAPPPRGKQADRAVEF